MKKVLLNKYGSPDSLKIINVEKPNPKENQVLIKLIASTVNRTDCALLRAKPFIMRFFTGLLKPKIKTSGTEFSGEIIKIGSSVSRFKVGDKVFGFNDLTCGSHAEYFVLNENEAMELIPDNIDETVVAASSEGAHYAINFYNKVKIEKGDEVFVNGGTGGIGSALIQFLKYFGANITATCREEHFELVKSLGANEVIDYTKGDYTISNKKYKYVFDAVGKNTFGNCKKLLQPGGVYISSELGPYAQNLYFGIFKFLTGNKKVIFPLPLKLKENVKFIQERITNGDYKPIIDKEYKFEDIIDVFKYVEKGQKVGNVVVRI